MGPSPSPLQPPRRQTAGEVTVFRFHRDDDDSSDAHSVSDDEHTPPSAPHSGVTGPAAAVHYHDQHDAALLRGQPLDLQSEDQEEDVYEEEVEAGQESLELTLGVGGNPSFSFAASSVALEELPEAATAGDHQPLAAEEVAEEPSLMHMHKRGPAPLRGAAPPLSPPPAPEPPGSSTLPPPGPSGSSPSPPPHASVVPYSPPSGSAAGFIVGEDSVLYGSVVGATGEDSVLYGSPVRCSRTEGSLAAAAAGVGSFFSATSPLRLGPTAPLAAHRLSAAAYFAEATAVVYSPDRWVPLANNQLSRPLMWCIPPAGVHCQPAPIQGPRAPPH